jgi:uncharacterized protein YacL (UPF0231 family)
MSTALLMSAAASTGGLTGSFGVATFLQFGLLGVVFLCIVMKKFIVPEWTLTALKDQYEAQIKVKEDQISALKDDKEELKVTAEQLQKLTRDEMIPALVVANQMAAEHVQWIKDHDVQS